MFRFFETRIDFRKQPPDGAAAGYAVGVLLALHRPGEGPLHRALRARLRARDLRGADPLSHRPPGQRALAHLAGGDFQRRGPAARSPWRRSSCWCGRFGTILFRLLVNHSLAVSFTTMVHWQNYWHVVRQPLAFFQDDFAGRIANRVLQTGRPLRESILSVARAVWQILIFGAASIGLLGTQDIRLALPMAGWFTLYALLLVVALPRIQKRSRVVERGAFRRDRQGGGQLHQHHDGEAVRAPEGRGRLHQRGLSPAQRRLHEPAAGEHGLRRRRSPSSTRCSWWRPAPWRCGCSARTASMPAP